MYVISVVILFVSSIYFSTGLINLFERVEMRHIYEFVDLKL